MRIEDGRPEEGFKLWQINADLFRAEEEAVDHETGELDVERFAKLIGDLPLKRNQIVIELAARVKELRAEAAAIKITIDGLDARRAALTRKEMRLTEVAEVNAEVGVKLSDARVAIGWLKSTRTIVDVAAEALSAKFRRRTVSVVADKVAIKAALKAGKKVKGAHLEERNGIQIR